MLYFWFFFDRIFIWGRFAAAQILFRVSGTSPNFPPRWFLSSILRRWAWLQNLSFSFSLSEPLGSSQVLQCDAKNLTDGQWQTLNAFLPVVAIQCGHAACVDVCLVHVGAECFHWSHVAYHATYIHNPPPLKMYGEGGEAGICSYISTPPPPLKRVLLYELFFGKIKRLPKEVGDVPHTFSVFGFKSLFRKRWGGGFIHWFCKAMDLWCSWSFPGESYEIAATLLRPLPLFSKPRSFVRLQPWQRERLEIALDSLILWPDIERSCGNQSKGIINFLRLKQHVPLTFIHFQCFTGNHLVPLIYFIHLILSHLIISHPDYCSKWTWLPLCFIHFKIFPWQWIDSS